MCGVDVITTGNHVWDQKETTEHINNEKRLLRPLNLTKNSPGKGFGIFKSKNGYTIGVLNLMGNIFMKKCDDVFEASKKFLEEYKLKRDYDFLIVDFHGEHILLDCTQLSKKLHLAKSSLCFIFVLMS